MRGVSAGPFRPALWQKNTLNLVRDERAPLLEPAQGKFRNIYAPSIVAIPGGFRVYYGGWDGSPSGNDRIYMTTADPRFLRFGPRQLLIDHGDFQHVNNCSAVRLPGGRTVMLTTCYPAEGEKAELKTNKPGAFTSPDGVRFNNRLPFDASTDNLVLLTGYDPFTKADINGMNALLREGDTWRMYFGDFANFGAVHRASSTDARHWTYDGEVLKASMMVNDVRPIRAGGRTWYLMLLHHNGDSLGYSLSTDSAQFPPVQTLFTSAGPEEAYMVADGLVTDGATVYGVLYGAGAVKSLDQNRIFGRWLQKRVRFIVGGHDVAKEGRALGPDRYHFALPEGAPSVTGRFVLYDEDGVTRLWTGPLVTLSPGQVWDVSRP